ncbi:MAG: threonine/serine dehydratase [Anaerolineales bacterium]|nr:threonine/serine dehydratase [Anaerolineales bacterium]MDW8161788.1 threonine/serine dehydratase [Anaerolineales bacterium]
MIPPEWIQAASRRVSPYIRRTPITYDPSLKVFLKWENQQKTGSFKLRGALNKVLSLSDRERQPGVVAASAGNHGAGVAFACRTVGIRAHIFVPKSATQVKVSTIRDLGAEVTLVEGGYTEAEQFAIQYARDSQKPYLSPYNDGQVIAGQATLAFELLEELPNEAKAWLAPVSGGGLIGGIGAGLRAFSPKVSPFPQLIGVQSEASPYMERIYYTGSQDHVVELPSLADGLAGAVEPNSITIPLVKEYVDSILLVSEEEICEAIRYAWLFYHQVIEGSAAVVLAAILSGKIRQRPALLIISGGNIDLELHRSIVENRK